MARRSGLGALAVVGLIGGAYYYSKRKQAPLAVAPSGGTDGGQGTGEPVPGDTDGDGVPDYVITHFVGEDQPGGVQPPDLDFDPFDIPPLPPKPPQEPGDGPMGGIGEPLGPDDIPSQQDDDEPPKPYCAVVQNEFTLEPPTPKWRARKAYDASIFTVTPVRQKCKKWVVAFGVCLKTDHTFGLFDALTAAQRADIIWHVSNSDGNGINWNNWVHPNVWKAQMKGTVTVGVGKISLSGFVKINDDYEKGIVDPCPELVQRWPKPSGSAYTVLAEDSKNYAWKPFPSIEVVSSNMTLQARVSWSGFPVFQLASGDTTPDLQLFNDGHEHAVAYLNPTVFDDTVMMVKVWAAPAGQSDPQ